MDEQVEAQEAEARATMLVAKKVAVRLYPACSSLIHELQLVMTKQIPTAGCDRLGHLYYNPDWVNHCQKHQMPGLVLHEACHLLLQHEERGKFIGIDFKQEEDARLWNMAGDMEINCSLSRDGIPLPDNGMEAKNYNLGEGQNAEIYYRALKDNQSNAQRKAESEHKQSQRDRGQNPNQQPNSNSGYGSSDDGSASGGETRPWESKAQGMTPQQVANKLEQLRKAIERAQVLSGQEQQEQPQGQDSEADQLIQAMGNKAGSQAGNLPKLIKSTKHVNQTTWSERLRQIVARAIAPMSGRDNYSYNRISRRQVPHVVMPGMVGNKPRIVGVFDVSGSMDEEKLKQAANNMHTVASFGETWVVLWNTYEIDRFKVNAQTLQRRFRGGGGTHMQRGIAAVLADNSLQPDVVVCITDAETSWDKALANPRNVPVIVGVIGDRETAQAYVEHLKAYCPWATPVDLSNGG